MTICVISRVVCVVISPSVAAKNASMPIPPVDTASKSAIEGSYSG